MVTSAGPGLRRRQTGARLRALREAAGKSLDEVAAYLECSGAKVSRVETGRLLARTPDVRHMLDLYGASDAEREEILSMVAESRRPAWWSDYLDGMPDGSDIFVGLLDAAESVVWYEPYLMPGLLQTRAYAHAVLEPRTDLPDAQVDRIIDLRTALQRQVLNRTTPPDAHFYIEEAILRRTAGSPAVMRELLDHVCAVAEQPHVTVQVVSAAAGITAAFGTPFVLLNFPGHGDPPTVYIEQFAGSRYENRPDHVARYMVAVDSLRAAALSYEESTTLIRQAAQDFR